MGIEVMSPVGRFVQGSMSLEKKMDPQTNKPKLDENGQEIMEMYMSLAIRKDDPGLAAFYGAIAAQAQADFPHLFVNGNCTHPQFAMKVQDGDGNDSNGKSVKDKPGFAGHYIFKMATRYLPKCFYEGKFDPSQQIQNPAEVIKRGYYVRVNVYVSGNGVKPNETNKKPGIYLSPNLVSLVGFGEVIQGGPDAVATFAKAGAPLHLPPGMSATPVVGTGAIIGALPGLPAIGAPAAIPGLPALPGIVVPGLPTIAVPGLPTIAIPGAVAVHVPVFTMTAKAQGLTREQMHAQQWTDELMIQHGYAVMQ